MAVSWWDWQLRRHWCRLSWCVFPLSRTGSLFGSWPPWLVSLWTWFWLHLSFDRSLHRRLLLTFLIIATVLLKLKAFTYFLGSLLTSRTLQCWAHRLAASTWILSHSLCGGNLSSSSSSWLSCLFVLLGEVVSNLTAWQLAVITFGLDFSQI